MPWGRIDDDAWRHQRFTGVGPIAYGLFWAANSYSNERLLDGHLSAKHIVEVCGIRQIPPEAAHELIEAGLWIGEGDGIWVHDYFDYNDSKEEILAKREKNAAKQAAWITEQKAKAERARAAADPHVNDVVTNPVSNVVTNDPYPVSRYPGIPDTRSPGNPHAPNAELAAGAAGKGPDPVVKKPLDRQIWDAFALSGFAAPVTSSERSRWNGWIKDFRQSGVPPDEITALVAEYRARWPDWKCTIGAVLAHVAELRQPRGSPNGHHRAVDRSQLAVGTNYAQIIRDRTQSDHERRTGDPPTNQT